MSVPVMLKIARSITTPSVLSLKVTPLSIVISKSWLTINTNPSQSSEIVVSWSSLIKQGTARRGKLKNTPFSRIKYINILESLGTGYFKYCEMYNLTDKYL